MRQVVTSFAESSANIGNRKPAKDALEQLQKRTIETEDILKRCKIDGVISIANLKYELANGLRLGSIYNIPDDMLQDYLLKRFQYISQTSDEILRKNETKGD